MDACCIAIRTEDDIVAARLEGRQLSLSLGFSSAEATLLATAISELARNILHYAGEGEVELSVLHDGARRGISVVARDRGPGIPDIAKAMEDGFSTGRGLGLGLPGTKRMVDEFEIESEVGRGTTITLRNWER